MSKEEKAEIELQVVVDSQPDKNNEGTSKKKKKKDKIVIDQESNAPDDTKTESKKEKKEKGEDKDKDKDKKKVDDKPKEAVQIFLKANIFAIREINTVDQTFTADFFLEATWQDPKFKGKAEADIDCAKEISYTFVNLISKDREEFWTRKYKKEDDWIVYRTRFIGTFAQKFDLTWFPFDSQRLNFVITSKKTKDALVFKKSDESGKGDIICTDTETAFTLSEWRLWHHVGATPTETSPSTSSSGTVYTLYKFSVDVSRHPSYYIYNVMVIMFLLVSMSLTSWAVDVGDTGDRLSVTLTLVLTAVAFKSSVSDCLPKISYVTFLDGYLFWSFTFLVSVVLENALSGKLNFSEYTELVFFVVIAGTWIVFNVVELCRVLRRTRPYRKLMWHTDAEFSKKSVERKSRII